MIPIVTYPKITQLASHHFSSLFSNKRSLDNFCRYLTGLFSSENKTVSGMNVCYVKNKDQSNLNRWIMKSNWNEDELNSQRLKILQECDRTRYSSNGVIAIDNVLVDHSGKCIDNVGWFWDHAENRNKIAHDISFSNYVLKNGKHYPLEFNFFIKKSDIENKKTKETEFKTHSDLFVQLVEKVVLEKIPGAFTFDSYFTNKKNLDFLESNERSYVGDLKLNRIFFINKKRLKVSDFYVEPSERKKIKINNKIMWFYSRKSRLKGVDHPVRLVFFWKRKNSRKVFKVLATNRLRWDATRISKVYSYRWTGTETFHRDIKQHLGMGSCQLRGLQGLTRHIHLVCLAYSLLMLFLPSFRSHETRKDNLNTIGEACRTVREENLKNTITWISNKIMSEKDQNPEKIIKVISSLAHGYGKGFSKNLDIEMKDVFKDTG